MSEERHQYLERFFSTTIIIIIIIEGKNSLKCKKKK